MSYKDRGSSPILLESGLRSFLGHPGHPFPLLNEQGVFPATWKIGCVQPIPKKRKKTNPNKYRPVTLLNIMSKVMETVINTQVLNHMDNNNIIHDRQYGFRKHRSTGDLLAYVTNMWNRAIENHGESRAVELDISKAFDRVWHLGLLAKLAAYGVSSGLCRWLNSFLHDRSLFVVIEGCTSDVFSINARVPQGYVLSPTLFLLYINELLETTSNPIYSFADDSTLISRLRRHHHASQVNADIKKIVEWGLVNKVQFNVQKTQATTLTKKSPAGLPTVEMEGRPLVESPSIKKLYTPEQLLLLYKAHIRPSLEYCSHVWGCAPKHSLKLLDSIQNRAVKLIDTDNLTKNLHSLEHRRRVAGLSLFYRFYHGRCSSELSQIITPKAVRTRNTRDALHAHPYQVEVPTPLTSLLQHSFFWKTSTLWNELPGNNSTVDFQGNTPATTFNVNSRMAEVKFQHRDIRNVLQNLNTNKASGPDQIPAIVLKRCAVELTPILCKLFKVSYEQGVFPATWKIGCVQPIPKKGKKTDPNNYRPMTLLHIMSKVMETVINIQLLNYLDNNNIIHDRQYGFSKHRCTGDLLAYVTHMWNRAIENHGESCVVALDISKAFDRVWHLGLLAKLAAYGLRRRQYIDIVHGTIKPLTSQEITRRRHHHASQVNADIKQIVEWGLVNKVQFNVQKTQATTLTKKSLVGLPTVEMEGRPLVESPSIKLLGISINNNMSGMTTSPLSLKRHPRNLGFCAANRAVKLIDTDNLTKDLHSLEHRRRVAGLSLFYRFYHGRCSSELSQIITPKAVRTRNTREALHAHPYQVEVPTPRTSLLQHSFFWKTSTLWNELPGNDITNLFKHVLTTTYFVWDNINEQFEGVAMGSPPSSTVAIFVMKKIEQVALEGAQYKPKIWLRYVDDTFVIWSHGIERRREFLTYITACMRTSGVPWR
nr:unnamed protein product [Callosobruchus analis]